VGAELFRANRWTNIKKLTVAFLNFANALKKLSMDQPFCPIEEAAVSNKASQISVFENK
jgi:hypothetical protein